MNLNKKIVDILIITNESIDEKLLNEFNYLIVNDFKFTSYFEGIVNNEVIQFDYLIISEKIVKNVITEDGFIITNESFETSFDNYFAIGKVIKNNKSINDQLDIIINHIKGN